MKFTHANNIVLHYTDEGQRSGPALVFINSLGTDLRIWDGVVPRFASRYRIIRHDKRGHGLSDCPPTPYSIRQHAQDLGDLLEQLGVERVTLVGISVGGMIAMDFAASHPDRVSRLVLCDTAPKIGTAEMWNERIGALRAHGMDHLGDAILSRWFAPSFIQNQPDAARGYYHMLTRTPVDGYTGTCEAIRDVDLWPSVAQIQAPTLILCGAEDLATTPDGAARLATAIPNANYHIIDDAAHLPCIEQPAILASLIDSFLAEKDIDSGSARRVG